MKKRRCGRVCVGALGSVMALALFMDTASAGQMLPIVSARGGAIPANQGRWEFWTWGSDLDTSSLTDGDSSSGLTLWGLDNVQQPNGVYADTSAFALFRYTLPSDATAIRFTVINKVEGTDYLSNVHIEAWRPDLNYWAQARYGDAPRVPTTFSVTFDPFGNDGTYSTPTDIWGSNLKNIQDTHGQVMFVVYGGAALNQAGQYRLDLYEVSAEVVPEPSIFGLGGITLGVFACRRSWLRSARS